MSIKKISTMEYVKPIQTILSKIKELYPKLCLKEGEISTLTSALELVGGKNKAISARLVQSSKEYEVEKTKFLELQFQIKKRIQEAFPSFFKKAKDKGSLEKFLLKDDGSFLASDMLNISFFEGDDKDPVYKKITVELGSLLFYSGTKPPRVLSFEKFIDFNGEEVGGKGVTSCFLLRDGSIEYGSGYATVGQNHYDQQPISEKSFWKNF